MAIKTQFAFAVRASVLLMLALSVFAGRALGQGTPFNDVVWKANGSPAAYALVRVCTAASVGNPCPGLASVYLDAAETQPASNPVVTDANGNYSFYATPTIYQFQASVDGGATWGYTWLASVSPDGATLVDKTSTQTITGAKTFTGKGTFNGGVSVPDANGGSLFTGSISEEITLSVAGLTTDSSANLLPANSVIKSVACRVTTTIDVITNWAVGDGTTSARFCSANATLAAGTTEVCLNHQKGSVATDAAGPTQASATKLRITATSGAGNPTQGKVRCTVFYEQTTAPTS